MLKGVLTHVPAFNDLRMRRAATGGSDSPRYCYSVWLRHLAILRQYGFRIDGARVGELGPGDSIGIGLAALLSGAAKYDGLDVFPFSAKADLKSVLEALFQLYANREPIPDEKEFPGVRPKLSSYEFPHDLVDCRDLQRKAAKVRSEIGSSQFNGKIVNYHAPWSSSAEIALASLDLIFSQAVLEHVDDLEETYRAMFMWLKPGGYASHVIDFGAHHLSPLWNGHWAYSDWQWRLVRGKREFLLNREPLSAHINYAKSVGFKVLSIKCEYGVQGLEAHSLSEKFRQLDGEDGTTRVATLILRKA